MTNVEGMYSIYFNKNRLNEAKPPFNIRYSIFCGSAIRFSIKLTPLNYCNLP
jgi:hypothetical protein